MTHNFTLLLDSLEQPLLLGGDVNTFDQQIGAFSDLVASEKLASVLDADDMDVIEPVMNVLDEILRCLRRNGQYVLITQDSSLVVDEDDSQ